MSIKASSGPWKRIPAGITSPCERFGHVSISVSQFLFVFGGIARRNEYKSDSYIFDSSSAQWVIVENLPVTPEPRYRSAGASVGMVAYIFGGMSSKHRELNDLWAFDMTRHSWRKITPSGSSPSPRYGHTLVSYGSKLYLFGGAKQKPSHYFNDLWVFDTVSEQWSCSSPDKLSHYTPEGRYGHLMVYVPLLESFLIYGGSATEGKRMTDAWMCNPKTKSFTKYTFASNSALSTPSALAHASATTITDDGIMIVGGQNRSGPCSSTFVFLFQQQSPVIKAELIDGDWNDPQQFLAPTPRFLHTLNVATVGDDSSSSSRFLCMFGGTSNGTSSLEELWVLELNPFCSQLGLNPGPQVFEQVFEEDNTLNVSGHVSFEVSSTPTSSPIKSAQSRPSDALADVLAGYFRSHCSIRDVASVISQEIDRKVEKKVFIEAGELKNNQPEIVDFNPQITSLSTEIDGVKKSLDMFRVRLSQTQEDLTVCSKTEKQINQKIERLESTNSQSSADLYNLIGQVQQSITTLQSETIAADQVLLNKTRQLADKNQQALQDLLANISKLDQSFTENLARRSGLLQKAISEGDLASAEEIKHLHSKLVDFDLSIKNLIDEKNSSVESLIEEKVKNVESQVISCVSELESFKVTVDTEFSNQKSFNDVMNQSIKSLEESVENNDQSIQNQQVLIDNQAQSIQNQQVLIDNQAQSIQNQDQSISSMRVEIDEIKRAHAEELANQFKSFESMIATLQSSFTTQLSSSIESIKFDCQSRIEELESKLTAEVAKNQSLSQTIVEKESLLTTQSNVINQLSIDLESVKNTLNSLDLDQSISESTRVTSENLIEKIKSVKTESTEGKRVLQSKIEILEQNFAALQSEVERISTKVSSVDENSRQNIEELEELVTKCRINILSLGGNMD
ncbi:hypothetical protein RCL1_008475 [Eukaryota sp. TZLM3-RCL]